MGPHQISSISQANPLLSSTSSPPPLLYPSTTTTSTTNPTTTSSTTLTSTLTQPLPPPLQPPLTSTNKLIDDMTRQIEDEIDSIEIPARGRCRVFMAKYGYDPFKQSPNDNPDAELAFNAGDYIMVFDDIDEDGYFIGELMDGRRGYVPSNWLDRLQGEDLFEFQADILYKQASGGGGGNLNLDHHQKTTSSLGISGLLSSATGGVGLGGDLDDLCLELNNLNNNLNGSYPPEFYDAIIADTMNHSNFQHLLAPEDYHRMNDYVDLDDVNEVDDECLSDYERAEAEQMRRAVPPPQRLILERQLNKSILIAWLHPQTTKGSIVSYQVYVDGVLKSTVPSGDRTKALLEGVDSNIPHRISVRAIDLHGRHSNDAGCTIVIGQRIPFAPSCVKASHITSDSALISWLPCNSNFHHVVAVNSVEVQTVRPGVYKHLINGLSANTLYRVWVRAKPGKILSIDEKNPKKLESLTTYVDFKTMPKSLPDPPVNVQVEAGPQRRTLLVTWLPLTLNDFGSSNGCAVTGYAVFAGHKKLADIDSPTGDHALLDIGDLESLHKKSVTVRTKSGENLSQDSMPCQIPDEYLKANNKYPAGSAGHHNQASGRLHSQSQMGTAGAGYHHQSSSSPSRQRLISNQHHHHPNALGTTNLAGSYQQQRGARYGNLHHTNAQVRSSRPLARSLQNLESDLESRRSSIPAIEITRETSGSEMLNNQTESYSEEEFENSMRFRGGVRGMGKMSGRGMGHFRSRQSHSVDGHHHHHHGHGHHPSMQQQLLANRQFAASQASLAAAGRHRGGATPAGGGHPQEGVRYFVALFDYDPSTMSPNPNAAAEELAFKEGSIIRVHGGLGDDGFYKGELDSNGATGFVPCNVITEITDPSLLASLYEKNGPNALLHQQQMPGGPTAVHATPVGATMSSMAVGANRQTVMQQQQQQAQQQAGLVPSLAQQQQQANTTQHGGAVKRMVALYDYDPQENSPNADTESEIPFKTGDIIFVYGKMDTDGFYMGEVERTKQRGLVPSNFLREEPLGGKQQQPIAGQQQGTGTFMTGPGQQNMPMQLQQQQQFNQQAASGQNVNMMGGQQFNQAAGNQPMNAQQMQQQQLRAQAGPNMVRGPIGAGPQQQNINRPNSLSLGVQQQSNQPQQQMMMNNPQQQQQQLQAMQMQQNGLMNSNQQQAMLMQQQQLQGMNTSGPQNQFMGGPNQMNPQQRNQQQMNMMQQQQQTNQGQNPGSGVLGNLLSSGKQIIGAATTPRAPNQPNLFPGQNMQQQQPGGLNQMMPGQNMAPSNQNNMMMMNQQRMLDGQFGGNRMPQQQQQHSAMNAFNQVGGGNQQVGLMESATNMHQQQPLGLNSFAMGAGGGGSNAGLMGNNQQQQPAFNPSHGMQGGGGMNFNSRPGMQMAGGGAGMNQMGGEEPGLLNTVKNIFKL